MDIKDLHTLFVDLLKDLYSAEKQLVQALPKMAEAATDEKLKLGFEEHLKQTEEHVSRLEEIAENLGNGVGGKKCVGMEGLVAEGEEIIKSGPPAEVLDAGLIAAAQKVEHYEIASYGTAITWAELMGHDRAVELLKRTLDEEEKTNEKLTAVAEGGVNEKANKAM